MRNKVLYNIFSKCYKDTRKQIVEVTVDGRPSEEEASVAPSRPQPQSPSSTPVRILVEIWMSNGLHISQKNLNYQELVQLVEKLEGLSECYRTESFLVCARLYGHALQAYSRTLDHPCASAS